MEYLTLSKMKKSFPWCKTSDGKQTVLFDLSDLDRTWFKEPVIKAIMPHLEKYVGMNTYENVVFSIPVNTEESQWYITLEFNVTHVYSEKTGKKLYTLKTACGFRIAQYKRNIYGIVENGTKPFATITYGTLDSNWKNPIKHDVEI